MKKIDWKNVGKKVGNIVENGFILALTYGFMFSQPRKNVYVTKNYGGMTANYSKAAKAIVESDMLDHYKADAMEALKHDGDADYYETVISIANSDMLDHYKADMITKLS